MEPGDEDYRVYNELLSEMAERALAGEPQPTTVYLPGREFDALKRLALEDWPPYSSRPLIEGGPPFIRFAYTTTHYRRAPRYPTKAY